MVSAKEAEPSGQMMSGMELADQEAVDDMTQYPVNQWIIVGEPIIS